jgi:hypothetical protein
MLKIAERMLVLSSELAKIDMTSKKPFAAVLGASRIDFDTVVMHKGLEALESLLRIDANNQVFDFPIWTQWE